MNNLFNRFYLKLSAFPKNPSSSVLFIFNNNQYNTFELVITYNGFRDKYVGEYRILDDNNIHLIYKFHYYDSMCDTIEQEIKTVYSITYNDTPHTETVKSSWYIDFRKSPLPAGITLYKNRFFGGFIKNNLKS